MCDVTHIKFKKRQNKPMGRNTCFCEKHRKQLIWGTAVMTHQCFTGRPEWVGSIYLPVLELDFKKHIFIGHCLFTALPWDCSCPLPASTKRDFCSALRLQHKHKKERKLTPALRTEGATPLAGVRVPGWVGGGVTTPNKTEVT